LEQIEKEKYWFTFKIAIEMVYVAANNSMIRFVIFVIVRIGCDCSLPLMEPSICRGQTSLMLISVLVHQQLITGYGVVQQVLTHSSTSCVM